MCGRHLVVIAIGKRLVDVVAALPGDVSVQLGSLLFESWVTPVVTEGKTLFHFHEVDDLVSSPLCARCEANDPIVLFGMSSDTRLAASQCAVAEKRVRRKASVMLDDIEIGRAHV